MITLGVYNDGGEHAAVVVADGAVVSAVHAAGPDEHAALPASAERALALAGVRAADVDIICATDGHTSPFAQRFVAPAVADAAQVRAIAPDTRTVVVVDDAGSGRAWSVELGSDADATEVAGAHRLLQVTGAVAQALGLPCEHPIAALESIAGNESCAAAPASIEPYGNGWSIAVETSAIDAMLKDLAARCASPAEVAASAHVGIQRLRTQAATGMLEGLADAIAGVAQRAAGTSGIVALGGTACASLEFVARVRRRVDAIVAPVPTRFGAALGAALLPHERVRPLTHLALGASFSEDEVKGVLENCRLDYVYEPDWSRLYARVSDLLATGALVGWYQGRADFSRQSFGSRSILCDPSRRYSRENVNVFLLNRHAHAPLPVSFDQRAASGSAVAFAYSAAAPAADTVRALGGAVDHGRLHCHVADPLAVPQFHALLRTHRERTQVAGLVNVPMRAGAVLAPTPRDAVRETYASATDALVIGRFVVAKDYWLLRGRSSR